MPAPTLFRRLVLAQLLTSFAMLLVFGAVFYVERNRAVARLSAQRWAPALRNAAGLAAPSSPAAAEPGAAEVHVVDELPPGAMRTDAWAPRIAMLRETLREDGVPAGRIVFSPGQGRPTTWVQVAAPDGHMRWLGFDDEVVESHLVQRLLLSLALGFVVVASVSGIVARRLARPLEALRRRIEAHDGPGARTAVLSAASSTATLEIAAIESAWRALGDRLDRQESERALLLAGVSHDLRSPLARIRMAAELLPENPDLAPRRASIVRNVDVADRLVASFLEYVRASELPLESTVDLSALAERLVRTRDEPAAVLSLSAPPRLDVSRAHELLLERLIGNLVDNALRHGKPPVRLRLQADGWQALIDVEDAGAGIAPAEQARMTQAFARGEASRGTPGTGLGLAIVQQIVHRMGGTLSFESTGGTARVRVCLPTR